MEIPFVDLKAQYRNIKLEINEAINKVIDNTAFINGPNVGEFETNFANLLGVKSCIGVGNGTDALIICLKTLGIGRNDEVITVANSFIATSEAITAVGAKVVFVDNLPETYNINFKEIEKKITKQTKAIIPVHLYGQMAVMDPILEIAKKYNLKVIEDCAQAHLAEYKSIEGWKMAGTMGDMATFSFFPGKNLGAYGDAGAIVTNNEEYASRAKMFANHGRIAKYNHEIEGYNSRLDGMQAAILNVKIKYIKDWTNKRRIIAKQYTALLSNIKEIHLPQYDPEKTNPVWHLYVIRTANREKLQACLNEKKIATGVHYPIALPNLLAYQYLQHKSTDFPIATEYQNMILSLPIYPELSEDQIIFVTNSIKNYYS
jgi:dTDP-4-amino-4,6-dideoxygalactose transaminase